MKTNVIGADIENVREQARTNAKTSGRPQAIWVVGPGRYATTSYQPGDEERQGYLEQVEPDQAGNQ